MSVDLSLYLVTNSEQATRRGHTLTDVVTEAVAGGVTAVQVREKNGNVRDTLRLTEALAAALPPHVSLFINDRVDVFLAARARGTTLTGVHVGQSDLPVESVRLLIGPDPVIGLSASTGEQLVAAEKSAARVGYVGIGAVHTTSTKKDAPTAIGVTEVGRLARTCALPAVAIGGITPADLPALRAGGLAGAAVVSWICASANPRQSATELLSAWRQSA